MEPPHRSSSPDWLARRDHGGRTHGSRRASYRENQRERLLADWLGGVFAADAMAELRGPVQKVGDVVQEVLAGIDADGVLLLDTMLRKWPELVGEDIARVSAPVRCEEGVLWVGVTSATWRCVLEQQHRANILARLREATRGAVRSIRFVPAGAGSTAQRFRTGNRPGT